jgi:alkylhydroperoxidase family enzyme
MARIGKPDERRFPHELQEFMSQIPRHAAFDLLAHSVATVMPFLKQGQAQFAALELPERSRELVVLTAAVFVECEYEFVQHVPISEAAGVTEAVRDAIRRKDLTADVLSDADRALVAFVAAVLGQPTVPDDVFQAVRSYLTDRELVEVLQVTGYYWSFGRLCTVLDVEIEPAHGTEVIEVSRRLQDR